MADQFFIAILNYNNPLKYLSRNYTKSYLSMGEVSKLPRPQHHQCASNHRLNPAAIIHLYNWLCGWQGICISLFSCPVLNLPQAFLPLFAKRYWYNSASEKLVKSTTHFSQLSQNLPCSCGVILLQSSLQGCGMVICMGWWCFIY